MAIQPFMTDDILSAFRWASELHKDQTRKSTDIPYITHLMAVASIVWENGGDEDAVIAALLHDAVEDQGHKATLADIEKDYGTGVARIVKGCTDTDSNRPGAEKEPWPVRKERYVNHLTEADDSTRLVSMADKLHNARSITADLRVKGEETWLRFNASRDDILAYYRSLSRAFRKAEGRPARREGSRLLEEFTGAVDTLRGEAEKSQRRGSRT